MLYKTIRFLLFCFPPETAHKFTLNFLKFCSKLGLLKLFFQPIYKPREVFNLKFHNCVGLAAGLDKNANYFDALFDLGFGFIEVGTVTLNAQVGNPKPRLFRLPEHEALINCMGLNNKGIAYFTTRLKQPKRKGILGVSIAKNNVTPLEKSVNEYLILFQQVYPYADYVSLDISCPNVPGLPYEQGKKHIENLLLILKQEQKVLRERYHKYVPLLVKVSPDLSTEDIQEFANMLLQIKIDGVIATNTTKERPDVGEHPRAKEKGGLSGKPLYQKSLHTVQVLQTVLQNKLPIIAVGGIMSAADAQQMLAAGASLVQIYTGLIYKGPQLISEIAAIKGE
jgi:dihydroorotate dehydrogenase